VAGPEQVEGVPVDGVDLAAVDRQRGARDKPGGHTGVEFRGDPARLHRWRLAGIAQHPHLAARTDGDRLQDGVDVAGRGLGHLVEHDHGSRHQRLPFEFEAQPGDGRRRQAGVGEFGDRLGRRGDPHDHTAISPRGMGGGMNHGRLAIAGRGEHGPHCPTPAAQHRHGVALVRTQLTRGGHRADGDRRAGAGLQPVEQVEGGIFEGPVGGRGPAGRLPPRR